MINKYQIHREILKRDKLKKILYSYLPYLLPLLTHEEIEKDFRGTIKKFLFFCVVASRGWSAGNEEFSARNAV